MPDGKDKKPKHTHTHEELMQLAEEALNEEREYYDAMPARFKPGEGFDWSHDPDSHIGPLDDFPATDGHEETAPEMNPKNEEDKKEADEKK